MDVVCSLYFTHHHHLISISTDENLLGYLVSAAVSAGTFLLVRDKCDPLVGKNQRTQAVVVFGEHTKQRIDLWNTRTM